MVSLLRNGPRMLMISTKELERLSLQLQETFLSEVMVLEQVFDSSDENHTILFLVSAFKDRVTKGEIGEVHLIKKDTVALLCELLNHSKTWPIEAIRPAPQTLILRVLGDMQEALANVQADIGGQPASFIECMENGGSDSVVLGFLNKEINHSAKLSDFFHHFLLLEQDSVLLKRALQMRAFRYAAAGLNHKHWHEVEIRIYDSYGAYQVHYDRMMAVLDALELGIVIGEAWSKDYPRFMMAVEVFSVHLYTYKDPKEIKRILFALEHLEDGTRVVDYDLFIKGKKLYWRETIGGKSKETRSNRSNLERQKLYTQLQPGIVNKLDALETLVLESRF